MCKNGKKRGGGGGQGVEGGGGKQNHLNISNQKKKNAGKKPHSLLHEIAKC